MRRAGAGGPQTQGMGRRNFVPQVRGFPTGLTQIRGNSIQTTEKKRCFIVLLCQRQRLVGGLPEQAWAPESDRGCQPAGKYLRPLRPRVHDSLGPGCYLNVIGGGRADGTGHRSEFQCPITCYSFYENSISPSGLVLRRLINV